MNGRSNRWGAVLLFALVAAVVGYGAYNLGVSHGLAVNGSVATAAPVPGAAPVVVYPYGWHRPWGFGLFFPFLLFGFWFFAARAFFWRRPWHSHLSQGPGPDDLPPMFDQWHRRAHGRMKSDPSAH